LFQARRLQNIEVEGNKNLHILTSTTPTELRVDVQDWEGERRFAKYSTFKIGDASSKELLK
jgi:hypothetical protein